MGMGMYGKTENQVYDNNLYYSFSKDEYKVNKKILHLTPCSL